MEHDMSSNDSHGLQGKVALITGGTSGIGKATALAAARKGVHVVITGRRAPEGEAVVKELKALGVKALFVQGDVTDERHVESAVKQAKGLTGTLDFAFNNAGLELGGVNTSDSTIEQYKKIFDINVLGVLLAMKHEVLAMGAGGSIVNTSSIAGSIGLAGSGVYVASKHAVLGLTKTAALETAKQGIRVNAVSPGGIDTAMLDRFTGGKNPDAMKWMESMHPLGRVGTVDEVAKAVLFLWSSDSSFVTGHDLKVDGGFTTA
jgi:NAD(P)-dependent dehydrogenase (short-subunit alcohol dehydrogenase family)